MHCRKNHVVESQESREMTLGKAGVLWFNVIAPFIRIRGGNLSQAHQGYARKTSENNNLDSEIELHATQENRSGHPSFPNLGVASKD